MEYARDKRGKIVHHSVAKDYYYYECPYCFERVFIRRGLNACFFHQPIPNRTPQQRTCPEYHESDSYKKIDEEMDVVYINNGGIPLYLCNNGKRFQLRAYFPNISEESFNNLKRIGAKIHVNPNSSSQIDRKTYTVDTLDYYPVNTIEKWIDVICEPPVFDIEVQRKWLWGIRGVDIVRDIYFSNKDGGYRVALKANISIGKTYRIMFDVCPPEINGISFYKVGEIYLKEGWKNKRIAIHDMIIYKYTQEAREFIESKGYKLVEKANELLPLWPPGVFKGNEITFDKREVLFLYIDNSTRESLYYTLDNKLCKINTNKNSNSIIPLQTDHDKSFILSDGNDKTSNYELKYSIHYSPSLIQKQELKLEVEVKDSNGIKVNFDKENLTLPKDRKLFIDSNLPFCATVNYKNYVISSSSTCFENVGYFLDLKIDCRAFGIRKYSYKKKKPQQKTQKDINWELEYLRLYRCTAPTVSAGSYYVKLLHLLSPYINKANIQLYRLLETWIKANSIPVSAIKYVDGLLECLEVTANE